MAISPEEFMRAALAAGATVEYSEGALYATPRNEVVVASPTPILTSEERPNAEPPKETRIENSHDGYDIMKRVLSPWTNSHIAHISSALAIMHGARTDEWVKPGVDALVKLIEKVDIETLIQCVQRAGRLKHANKIQGRRITMSTGSLAAAMYDAMEVDVNLTSVDALEPTLTGQRLLDVLFDIANNADLYGGARSIEFRKRTYTSCLQVFTKLK